MNMSRIEELEKQKMLPPAYVEANVKKPEAEEKKQRKTRAPKHTHGRPRSAPTQIGEHWLVTCPDCQIRWGGVSVARVREIIDMPLPTARRSHPSSHVPRLVCSVREVA
jgi:hypothetical protein